MVSTDIVRLLTQGAFAAALLAGSSTLWVLMALQALNGTATAFFRPAASGLVQETLAARDRQRGNALLSAATNTAAVAGPALAAILIAVAGSATAVAVDAATFGASALFLYGVAVPPRAAPVRTGIRAEIVEGYRAVRCRTWVALEIVAFSQFQLFILAPFSILGPLVAQQQYSGATTWALVAILAGVGALLGDVIALRYRPTRPLVAANVMMFGGLPILLALAARPPLWALAATGLLFGMGLSLPNVYWFTALQDHIPDSLMARVSAFDWMGSMVLRPVGLAVVAPLAALVGTRAVLLTAAGTTLLTFALVLASNAVRSLTSTPHPEGAGMAFRAVD